MEKKDQQENRQCSEFKNAIDYGLQSGRSDLKISDIVRKVDNGEL